MKNTIKNLDISMNVRTFAVRQSYLHNSYVDFLYPYGTYFKIYRRSYTRVFICRIAVKRLSQTRVCFSFLFINK